MTLDQWITYCIAVFAGGIIPGPIMLLAMTSGAKYGPIRAVSVAMGNVIASILQVLISIVFVGFISRQVASLYPVLLAIGGLYLIYIAISLLRANPFKQSVSDSSSDQPLKSHDFFNVFVITLLNPKAIMFFIALFPQVIPRDHYSFGLVAAMTIVFGAIALLCFAIYAVFGSGIKRISQFGQMADVINFILCLIFIGLGSVALFDAVSTAVRSKF